MENRIAIIGIIIEKEQSVDALNKILHRYREYIIGRMGIPYHKYGVNIISISVDAPQSIINAISGQIGRLDGVSSKTACSSLKPKTTNGEDTN